jgi:SP family facilitated glucose transporter-like MFS transporter 8
MVYLFQDNVSHDSDLYNILSTVSLVGVVVSLSITFQLNICFYMWNLCNKFLLKYFVQAYVIAFSFGMGASPWIIMSEV